MIRCIVAGGRTFSDYPLLKRKLDALIERQARRILNPRSYTFKAALAQGFVAKSAAYDFTIFTYNILVALVLRPNCDHSPFKHLAGTGQSGLLSCLNNCIKKQQKVSHEQLREFVPAGSANH